MKISTILDHIDSGHMALPEFQRGYVWSRDQVRALFDSLYRRHPVGGLLVWVTESRTADHRGDGPLAPGVVKLLLDGQQRITSLYGVIRGKTPQFFDGNAQAFTNMRRKAPAFRHGDIRRVLVTRSFHLSSPTFDGSLTPFYRHGPATVVRGTQSIWKRKISLDKLRQNPQ